MGISENIIDQCINETIRKQLPVKNILKEYLGDQFNEQEDTDIVSSLSEIQEENLRKLVKNEVENNIIENSEKNNIKEEVKLNEKEEITLDKKEETKNKAENEITLDNKEKTENKEENILAEKVENENKEE